MENKREIGMKFFGGGILTMQYKLLALDIDGTLVNSEGKITPRVRQAIRNAVDAGCHVMLATGRFYRGMIKIQEELA